MGDASKPTVGFIGVGLMGHGMAKNIVEKGYDLVVMGHRNRAPVEDLVGRGAREVSSPAAMASACDVIHLCVTGSPQVEALVHGEGGLLGSMRKGAVLIDTSTSEPPSTLKIAEALRERGVRFADAPLSRTPKEAEAGTLDAMVGCDDETFAIIEPIIRTWAGIVVRTGPVGTGHTMKLLNNFIAMGYASLLSEAMAVGMKAGLSPHVFHEVIGAGRLRSGFYDTFMGYVAGGDPNAHKFALRNAAKDMRYLAQMASSVGAVNPMGAAVRNIFAAAEAAGHGDDMLPWVADFVAETNGVSLTDFEAGGRDKAKPRADAGPRDGAATS